MSSNGITPGPPFHEKDRENYTYRSSYSSLDNVLPPIAQPTRDRTMEGYPGPSPGQSPNQRIAETVENSSERRGPRLLGVHSILNPSHGEEDERRSRRRAASEMEEASRVNFTPPTSTAAPSRPRSSNELALAEASPPGQGGPRVIRRILTPISPRLQRATSFSRLVPGTIDATERPFLSDFSRINTPEHVTSSSSGMQQLPLQTSHVPQHSPFIIPAAPTPPLHPHPHPPHRRASVSVVGSSRPSPSPSSYAESYSQSGQTSPAMRPNPGHSGPTPPGSLRLTPSPNLGPLSSVPPGSLENEQGFHNTVVSTGQNYQMLTVDTSKGHMQLPVEVQAASRMADEKRKRNAGASARFRARRKEKEREASSKISNLEHELACAQEDSRHYKAERDYLADVILRNVPQYDAYLKNRPPSPRHTRMPHVPRPPMSIDSPLSMTDRYDSPEADRPVTRRRTESYPTNNPPPQHQYPPSPYTPYTPGHAPLPPTQQHMPPQQHPQQHPPPQYAHQSPGSGGLPPPLIARPPQAHEQHRPDQGYDHRSWPPRTNAPR